MGFVTSMFSGDKGAGYTAAQSGIDSGAIQNNYNSVNDQQQALSGQLAAEAAGGGPVQQATQAALTNATNQNIAQSAGIVAGAKGLNQGMAARLAGQNATQSGQQAANAAAGLTAQNAMAAQGQQAGVLGQMNGVNAGLLNSANQAGAEVASGNQKFQSGFFNNTLGALGSVGSTLAGSGGGGAGAAAAMAHGGVVPGKAPISGDSPENDKIHTMLSPGEIVIPRSATGSADKAKAFIDHLLASKDQDVSGYAKVLKAKKK